MKYAKGICAASGFEYPLRDLVRQYDGAWVHPSHLDPRHPSDIPRVPRVERPLPYTAPEAADRFVVPDWVPAGAIIATDFPNGRYWRSDIGLCAVGDIFEASITWGTAWTPETMIVPGIGLTTGEVTSGNPYTTAKLLDALFALVYDDGYCAVIEVEFNGGVIEDGQLLAGIVALDTDFDPFVSSSVAFWGPTGYVASGPGVTINNGGPGRETSIATVPSRFGANFDATTGTHLTSLDGGTGPTLTAAADYSEIAELLVNNGIYKPDGNGTTSTITAIAFYQPDKTQSELNGLTA